jgi:FdhE protein
VLHSTAAAVGVHAAGGAVLAAIATLASAPSTTPLTDDARQLDAWLRSRDGASRHAVEWLLGDDELAPPHPGLLRSVGWLTLAASLAPLVADFGAWRDEQAWMRRYCPTCGSLPAMGQLVGVDPGRQRYLSCGCCGTKWRYGRTLCPFCETDSHKAASVSVEGEHGLRIDHCEACRGYLKTYAGHGGEAVLLADWTSLHLDIAALERGWRRVAASLYDVDTSPPVLRGISGNPEVSPAT